MLAFPVFFSAFTAPIDFRDHVCFQLPGYVSLGFDVAVARSVTPPFAVIDTSFASTGSAGGTIKASIGPGNTKHQSRSEYRDTYVKVYNSDEDEAAHEVWYNDNAVYNAEHNAKGKTLHANGGIEGVRRHASAKLSLSERRLIDCFRMQNYPSLSSSSSIAPSCQHKRTPSSNSSLS